MGTEWDSLKQHEGALLIDKILELQETMHVIWSNLISQRKQTHRVKFTAAQLNLVENQKKNPGCINSRLVLFSLLHVVLRKIPFLHGKVIVYEL